MARFNDRDSDYDVRVEVSGALDETAIGASLPLVQLAEQLAATMRDRWVYRGQNARGGSRRYRFPALQSRIKKKSSSPSAPGGRVNYTASGQMWQSLMVRQSGPAKVSVMFPRTRSVVRYEVTSLGRKTDKAARKKTGKLTKRGKERTRVFSNADVAAIQASNDGHGVSLVEPADAEVGAMSEAAVGFVDANLVRQVEGEQRLFGASQRAARLSRSGEIAIGRLGRVRGGKATRADLRSLGRR